MGNFFAAIGTAIYNFITNPVVQAVLFVAQGVTAHQAAMKAKRTGADILLQKYGTGGGIPVIYGTRRVAGTVVYMETQNNRELYVVYAIAAHEIDSFDLESIQLDGRTIKDTNIYRQGYDISDGTTRINFRPSSVTRASGTFWGNTSTERANITGGANINNKARMTFNCHKGTTSQAADPMLEGILTDWTSNHKLTGIAYIAANYEYDTQGMFSGIPNLTIVVNGKKVFDPRDTGQTFGTESTYTHSSNAALCLLDYITNDDYGKGLGTSDLESDFASWKTAADDCDTSVDTIDHTGISVESASTDSDVMIIADASQTKFNKLKVGNKYTVDDGTTTYVNNKKLIDKDSTQIDIDGSNAFAILKLKFEDGAIDNAITSATSCDFAETQIRFDCNGVLDTEETVLENTKLLIANMRGIFTYANGKYQIKVEGAESSVVTLDEDDILESGITLSLENKEAKYNKVEAEFYNAQKRYESDTTYYTGETSDTFLADDGNEVLETRIQLPFCTNQRIAYNHAKGLLKRSRKQKTISFVATPKVLKAKVGEVITVSNTNLNLSSELYRITNMTINPDLNVAVTAIEYQTDVYGYVTPPDEDIDIPDDPPEGNRVVAPTNLTFTNKNATTGEAAKLTWTDSTKYPSYEFRVRIIDGLKTRYDKRVKDTYFYLDGISVKNGYEARVSAINALGVESDSTNITVNVTTEPITTPDIKQGSIGGFSFTDSKMYHPVDGSDTGTFETSNVYIDDTGQFSLKDKLSFDGTTLDISGNLTVENTITADKIVLDGINLDDLFAASGTAGNSTIDQSSKIFTFNWDRDVLGTITTYYGLRVDLTQLVPRVGIGVLTTPDDALHIKSGAPYVRLEDTGGYTRVKGVDTNIELEAGNTGSGYDNTSYILMDIAGNDVAKFHALGGMELPSLVPTTTTNRLYNNAGTLYWNGSAVGGGGSTTTINNNADNRVITGSNTADTLNGEANLTFDGSTLNVTGTISSGIITATEGLNLNASGTANTFIEVGANTASNHFAFIDLVSDTTYTDYGLRIIRNNGGANTSSFIYHRGTGDFNIETQDAAAIKLRTAAGTALTLDTSQNATFAGAISSGGITITDVAVPLKFVEAEYTGNGQYWRMPLDGGNLRFDVSTSGGASFTTYDEVFRLSSDGSIDVQGAQMFDTLGNINTTKTIIMNGQTVIDQSRNFLNMATINSTAFWTTSSAISHWGSGSGNGGTAYGILTWDTGYASIYGTGGNELRLGSAGGQDKLSIKTDGNVSINGGALQMSDQTVIDSSSNLTNIGTISASGDITTNESIWVNNNASGNEYLNLNYATGGDGGILFRTASALKWQFTNQVSTDKLLWYSYGASSTVMTLTSAGSLGIGTSSPQADFQVIGPAVASVPSAGSGAVGGAIFSADLNSYGMFVGSITNGNGYIQQQRTNTATYYNLLLQPNGGNVGINTTNPLAPLHVDGNVYVDTGHTLFSDIVRPYSTFTMQLGGSGSDIAYFTGKVGIKDNDPPSTLTVLGDNSADVASVGAGINGLQITRSTSSGENLYAYIGNSSLTGWSGSTFPARIENFGCNVLEIGSQQNLPVSFGTNNTERMRITSTGATLYNGGYVSVPIGSSYWIGNTADSGNRLRMHATTAGNAYIDWGEAGALYFRSGASTSTTRMSLDSSANLIVGGNITAYGSPSDIRLKENIATIENPLDKVAQLRGITFDYKKDGKRSTGLIAQELEKVLPEAVYETSDIDNKDDKFKAVRYGNVVGLLVEAIKELKAEIEELKK